MDALDRCKDLNSLKMIVGYQLSRRSIDPCKSWNVIAIDQSDQDAEFSEWLTRAMDIHRVLKRRSSFTVRSNPENLGS